MTTSRVTPFLRWALLGDALASSGTGLLMVLLAAELQGLLQVPAALLFNAGLVLIPYAAIVAFLGARESLPNWAVWSVIAVNLLWAVDSIVLLGGDRVSPNALGYTFIIGQALVVAGFAELQMLALRRSRAVAA